METENAGSVKPDYVLRVKKAKNSPDWIEIGLRELDEPTYMAFSSLFKSGKDMDAIRAIILNCRVSGDRAEEITDPVNWQRLRAARGPILEFLEPMDGELKKN